MRYCLWAYFFLVIFEGALRKWILPQLATPLLVVRDPICVVAIIYGIAPLLRQQYAIAFAAIGILGVPLAMVFGHQNLFVALFGGRIWVLHFPLMFLFPAVFDREDLWKFAKAFAAIAIGMTVLLALQFYSPPSHFLNVGVGGEGDSLFSGAGGRYRCSGTFSFTNGLSAFYGLAAAMFAAFLTSGRRMPKWMYISAGCLALAMPLAISRTIAFQYAITVVLHSTRIGNSPHLMKNMLIAVIAMSILCFGLSFTPVFQDSVDAFSQRWESASQSESDGQGCRWCFAKSGLGVWDCKFISKFGFNPIPWSRNWNWY